MGTTDTKIFDKDTLLDLTVNFVPLAILLFFIVYIALTDPWSVSTEPLILVVTLGLHVVPFVSLALLTYFSGKAIAGSEKEGEVYLAGRASVSSADPLESEHHGEADEAHTGEIGEPDAAARAAAEGDAETAEEEEDDASEDDSDTRAGTPDRTSAEGESGTEESIETGTADETGAGTKDASDSTADDGDGR